MQREFLLSNNPECAIWDAMWTTRTIEQELEACDIESPPRELFLSYLSKGDRIIDAGCGFGKWVIYLKRQGYHILGIDDNKLAIARLKEFDPSVQVEVGDILDIQYPDNSFDAYISMGVVEHFEDGPLPALREAYRLLKPDGLVFESTPTVNVLRHIVRRRVRGALDSLPTSFKRLRSNWGKSKRTAILSAAATLLPIRRRAYCHFMEYRFSKSELESYLKDAGFAVVETVPHDHYDSKDHGIGLVVDFPLLGARNGVNFRLNRLGKLISQMLDRISPWIACASVLCVGRALKEQPDIVRE